MSISIRVPKAHVKENKVIRSIRVCNVCDGLGCDCCQSIEEVETIFVSQIRVGGEPYEVFPFGETFGTSINSCGDELMPYVTVFSNF